MRKSDRKHFVFCITFISHSFQRVQRLRDSASKPIQLTYQSDSSTFTQLSVGTKQLEI